MWAPIVTNDQREEFEQRLINEYGNETAELGIKSFNKNSQPEPRVQRRIYYPIERTTDLDQNKDYIGFDLGSDQQHISAIYKASETDQAVATELLVSATKENSILLLTAYRKNGLIEGLSLGVLLVNDLLLNAIPQGYRDSITMYIFDETSGDAIFAYDKIPLDLSDVTGMGGVPIWRNVSVGLRVWKMAIFTTSKLRDSIAEPYVRTVVGVSVGIGFTLVWSVICLTYFHVVSNHSSVLEQLNATHTCALAIVNMELEEASEIYSNFRNHSKTDTVLDCCADIIEVMKQYKRFLPRVWKIQEKINEEPVRASTSDGGSMANSIRSTRSNPLLVVEPPQPLPLTHKHSMRSERAPASPKKLQGNRLRTSLGLHRGSVTLVCVSLSEHLVGTGELNQFLNTIAAAVGRNQKLKLPVVTASHMLVSYSGYDIHPALHIISTLRDALPSDSSESPFTSSVVQGTSWYGIVGGFQNRFFTVAGELMVQVYAGMAFARTVQISCVANQRFTRKSVPMNSAWVCNIHFTGGRNPCPFYSLPERGKEYSLEITMLSDMMELRQYEEANRLIRQLESQTTLSFADPIFKLYQQYLKVNNGFTLKQSLVFCNKLPVAGNPFQFNFDRWVGDEGLGKSVFSPLVTDSCGNQSSSTPVSTPPPSIESRV